MQFEESGVGESQGNAAVEWAILGDRVDDKDVRARSQGISVKFEVRYLVRIFAVEHSAQFANRAQQRRTVCELRKSRPHERKFAPFARTVMDFSAAEKRSRQKFEGGTQAFALVSLRNEIWSS